LRAGHGAKALADSSSRAISEQESRPTENSIGRLLAMTPVN
jgi:hypothetical protein